MVSGNYGNVHAPQRYGVPQHFVAMVGPGSNDAQLCVYAVDPGLFPDGNKKTTLPGAREERGEVGWKVGRLDGGGQCTGGTLVSVTWVPMNILGVANKGWHRMDFDPPENADETE